MSPTSYQTAPPRVVEVSTIPQPHFPCKQGDLNGPMSPKIERYAHDVLTVLGNS